jgi:putative membrane protein
MSLYRKREKEVVKPGPLTEKATHFSWLRTRMSTERTLMSWLITGTSLIGLGFTIFQLFESLSHISDFGPPFIPRIPRNFSLALIGFGTLSLILATYEYLQRVRYLWKDEFRDITGVCNRIHWSPAIYLAILLILLGVVTFGSLFSRPVSTEDDLNNFQDDGSIEINYHNP